MYYAVFMATCRLGALEAKSSKYRLMYYLAYYTPGNIKHLPDSLESEICK